MAMARPLGWIGPGEKEALVGRGLLNAPLPPVSGAWCGRLRLECLGRAEAAARNMAAAPSPNLFGATLQLTYTGQAINDTLACITWVTFVMTSKLSDFSCTIKILHKLE